jgi:SAM-dependent methyltransferase
MSAALPLCAAKVYANAGNLPLLSLVADMPPGRALDLGCGAGDNATWLSARGWDVVGVTLSSAECALASAHCSDVIVADLEKGLPPSLFGSFDLVLASHVLEHLRDPARLLSDVARRLIPGGKLLVALPNVAHYPRRLKLLFGDWRYTHDGLMDDSHLRFFTFETGAELLLQTGFCIVRAAAVGQFPWWKSRRLIPAGVREALDRLVCRHWPNLFAGEMHFLAFVRDET